MCFHLYITILKGQNWRNGEQDGGFQRFGMVGAGGDRRQMRVVKKKGRRRCPFGDRTVLYLHEPIHVIQFHRSKHMCTHTHK